MTLCTYRNTDTAPIIEDRVQFGTTSSSVLEGEYGTITGWATPDHYLAIITLDSPLVDGTSTVVCPVVCLDHSI